MRKEKAMKKGRKYEARHSTNLLLSRVAVSQSVKELLRINHEAQTALRQAVDVEINPKDTLIPGLKLSVKTTLMKRHEGHVHVYR